MQQRGIQSTHAFKPFYRGARGVAVPRLLTKAGTAGNLVTDAQIAALALEYGATVHSTDTDFVRLTGVSWENPLLA